jgi:hypothetical protein
MPVKSGLPSAVRGVGADKLTLPSAVRGSPGVRRVSHWAPAGTADNISQTTKTTFTIALRLLPEAVSFPN